MGNKLQDLSNDISECARLISSAIKTLDDNVKVNEDIVVNDKDTTICASELLSVFEDLNNALELLIINNLDM